MPPRSRRRVVEPAQHRSRITLERILTSATTVLVDHGLPAFNTNAVAAEAGVNVSTLYHYFPDKQEILRTLFQRDEAQRGDVLLDVLPTLADVADLDAWVHDVAVALLGLRRNTREGVLVRRACRAMPELAPMVEESDENAARVIALAFKSRFTHLDDDTARRAALAVQQAGGALVDHIMLNPMDKESMLAELERLFRGFLRELAAETN